MDMEKRMAGDYEITQALRIGDKEIVLGRNRAAQPGQEFLCAFYESNAILGMYSDCIVWTAEQPQRSRHTTRA